jgi:alkylated DNA repair dioxygenase AlkB
MFERQLSIFDDAPRDLTPVPSFDLPDLDVLFVPRFYGQREAADLFAELREATPWHGGTWRFKDKVQVMPRLVASYRDEDSEAYPGEDERKRHAWTPTLLRVREQVEKRCGERFDSVLLSLYRDQHDSVAWHRDREIGRKRPLIAALSLGSTRKFMLRHVARKGIPPLTVHATPGSLLVLRGPTNDRWEHHVPKLKEPCGERISLTFRRYGR